MTLTIALSNQKGGVAKTTSTLSLGASLAELGHSVLMVDLDPQAHLTLSLGFEPEKLHRNISDVLLGNKSLVSVSRESEVFDLDILSANSRLALIEKLLYGQKGYEYILKRSLATLKRNYYDVVVMDCPPTIGVLTLNALTAADLLVIPVQCEYYAARSLRQTIGLAKLVRQKTNPQLAYQILITMYDRRNRISRIMLEQIQNDLAPILLDTIIEVDTKLRESPVFGQPITVYAPNTRGAQQYRTLAKELVQNGKKGS